MNRVSDVITKETIQGWNKGQIITVTAGTGVGKSYWVKNTLYDVAKSNGDKILFLLHRVNCVNQFKVEIERENKSDVIKIMTYQSLESLYKNNIKFNFKKYKYIVADEFHYFMSDGSFSKTTDMSLQGILDQTDKYRIFMSATSHYITKYIKNYRKYETLDYELPIDFSFIKELTFFNKDETMEQFIEEAIAKNQKVMLFIQSAKKGYNLYQKYKDYAVFNCSKNNKEYYKYVKEKKINKILENEKFEELVFITTLCFDAGINIVDEELKHIVCDVKDKTSLIQCIGRKRIQHNQDKLYLYIKGITNQQLGGIESQLKNKIEMASFLRKNSTYDFIKKYPREYDEYNIVYLDTVEGQKDSGVLKVNDLMYFKCLADLNDISIMKTYGKYAYCKFLAYKFGFYDEDFGHFNYRLVEEEYMKNELDLYLDSIVGKKLLKEQQEELIEKIQLKDARGRIQKSIKLFNAYFVENEMNYMIVAKRTNQQRYWEVIGNVDIQSENEVELQD